MILSHLCHQFPILSMHSCYSSDVLTVLQDLEELAVSQHVHVLIGHEHLKGIHSFLSHQLLHLSSHLQEKTVEVSARTPLNLQSILCILHFNYNSTLVFPILPIKNPLL